MKQSFIPHPLIRGGHLQTLVAKYFGPSFPLAAHSHLKVNLPDGDFLRIDINKTAHPIHPSPVLLILFHGLGGSTHSEYMLRIGHKALQLGFDVARVNHRGAADEEAKGIYHSGSVKDMWTTLLELHKTFPEHQLIPAAFSLSGTILLNTLSAYPQETAQLLRAAIAVCSPLDLEESSLAIARFSNIQYDKYYTYHLKRHAQKLAQRYPEVSYPSIKRVRNLRDFDEVFTAKVGGFQNRLDYYKQCSPYHKLYGLQTTTHILLAEDDPIVPLGDHLLSKVSSQVAITRTSSGGHLGFISREPTEYGDRRWMDAFIFRILAQNQQRLTG